MARKGLVLCTEDDEKVTQVFERIQARAASLRQDAAYVGTGYRFASLVSEAAGLEWAAALLMGTTTGGDRP